MFLFNYKEIQEEVLKRENSFALPLEVLREYERGDYKDYYE